MQAGDARLEAADAGLDERQQARVLERCQAILRDVAALESGAAAEREEAAGALVVTASVVFGRLHVLPIVTELMDARPSAQPRIIG